MTCVLVHCSPFGTCLKNTFIFVVARHFPISGLINFLGDVSTRKNVNFHFNLQINNKSKKKKSWHNLDNY